MKKRKFRKVMFGGWVTYRNVKEFELFKTRKLAVRFIYDNSLKKYLVKEL